MPTFSYTAVNDDGALVKGVLEAPDRTAAAQRVESGGLVVTDVRRSLSAMALARRVLFRKKVKRQDIIEFANTISFMLAAGVPITTSLSDIAESIEDKTFRNAVEETRKSIEQGSTFSEALSRQEALFPDILIRLAAVGEETGALDNSLRDVAEHLQRIESLVAAVKRALMYPLFALFTTGGALIFWLVFVLPQIMEAFTGMGITLPSTTRLLLYMSNATQRYWYMLLLIPVIAAIAFKLMTRSRRTRYYVDLALLHMPIFKLLNSNRLLALFTEQLRILTVAGITIDRSLRITAETIENEVFRTAIENIIELVTTGSSLSDAMRKQHIFPPLVIRLIDVGEKSGTIDTQLAFLAQKFHQVLDDVAEKLGKMIEPIIILVIGLMFLFIIVSLLMPVYDLVTNIGA